jgi:hypothetical protein
MERQGNESNEPRIATRNSPFFDQFTEQSVEERLGWDVKEGLRASAKMTEEERVYWLKLQNNLAQLQDIIEGGQTEEARNLGEQLGKGLDMYASAQGDPSLVVAAHEVLAPILMDNPDVVALINPLFGSESEAQPEQ